MLTFPLKGSWPKPEPIALADGQSFTLLLSRPSYDQRLQDEALQIRFHLAGEATAYTEQTLHRLSSVVVGWDGVIDADEKPVPFSVSRLVHVLGAFPGVAKQVLALVKPLFADDQVQLGESAAPPEISPETSPAADGASSPTP